MRIAVYYPSSSTARTWDIELEMLLAAADQVIERTHRWLDLDAGALPSTTPGPQCSWCPLTPTCTTGSEWLAR